MGPVLSRNLSKLKNLRSGPAGRGAGLAEAAAIFCIIAGILLGFKFYRKMTSDAEKISVQIVWATFVVYGCAVASSGGKFYTTQ